MPFSQSRLDHVVAVEFHRDSNAFAVFQRLKNPQGNDAVTLRRVASKHYFIVDTAEFLASSEQVVYLKGEHPLRYLALYDDHAKYQQALKTVQSTARRRHGKDARDHLWARNPVDAFLIRSGINLFSGLQPQDLKVLALDLETYTSKDKFFPDAKDPEDRIIVASLADNRGKSFVLSGLEMTEAEIIQAICKTVVEEDYDVICGHNLVGFDLPYLRERASQLSLPLNIGRDGSPLTSRDTSARRSMHDEEYQVFGRHIIDTLPLLMQWDFTSRRLTNLQLKTAVVELGLTPVDRTDFDRSNISALWDERPEEILSYALDDARDSLALYEFLSPSEFYQTQILPVTFQQCVLTGTGTKVDLLMQRAYLQEGHSLPIRGALSGGEGTGGLTEALSLGMHKDVYKADVASLYPSICLSYDIKPRTDTLGYFLQILKTLTERRLEAKGQLKSLVKGTVEYGATDALQNSFKILINSFYGMLGTGGLYFADAEAGGQITQNGQSILLHMVRNIEVAGGMVVEIDTDGVYFTLPEEGFSGNEVSRLVGKDLHPGIKVEFDGYYHHMYSYASKNYLLMQRDTPVRKGVVFRSRKLYKLQDDFIDMTFRLLCQGKVREVSVYYHQLKKRIMNGQLTLAEATTTHPVDVSWEEYGQRRESGSRSKVMEMLYARPDRDRFTPRTRVVYYHAQGTPHGVKLAEDFAEGIDSRHYLEVLKKTAEKFLYALQPEHWAMVFGDEPCSRDFEPWNFRPTVKTEVMDDYKRVVKGDYQMRLF